MHSARCGLRARCWCGPRPRPAQRARRWRPSSAGPRNARRRHRRTGDGGSPARRRHRGVMATGERRETAADRESAALDRDGRDGGASEATVGATAARARRSGGGQRGRGGRCRRRRWHGERGALSGGLGRAARQLSGRAARYLDSGFKPRRRRSAWRPRSSGARRTAADRWGRCQ
jgi:hypothetical protein